MEKLTGTQVLLIFVSLGTLLLGISTLMRHSDASGWLRFTGTVATTCIFILAGFGIAYISEKRHRRTG